MASLSKAQICTAFGEKEEACHVLVNAKRKCHCWIGSKIAAELCFCRGKQGKVSAERKTSPSAGKRHPGTRSLDSLHQPQRESFLVARVGS